MKVKDPILHYYFLNKDISVTDKENSLEFSRVVLEVSLEGSMSQIFYLGPSFYFMLCRTKYFINKGKVTRFLT